MKVTVSAISKPNNSVRQILILKLVLESSVVTKTTTVAMMSKRTVSLSNEERSSILKNVLDTGLALGESFKSSLSLSSDSLFL